MSTTNLIPTLFGQEEFSIISDSEEFLSACLLLKLNTVNIFKIEKLPINSIIFSFSNEAAKKTFEIAKQTEHKRCVFCAIQVFEPSLANALYSLKLLISSNFEFALAAQRFFLNMLNSNNSFSLSGNNADAQVTIFPHARPYALLREDINNNFVHSVAEFFEVHYAHMNPNEPCPFSFSGTLKIEGILTVLRKPNPTLPEGIRSSLQWLSKRIAEETAYLSVKDNIVTSIKIKNDEYVKLLDLAAGTRGLNLTEFAIGVNDTISPNIDFKINSQMNEGVRGIHLAVGDGSAGYHIDLLSPNVIVNPSHL